MKRIAFLIVLCVSFLCAHAETLVLRTGARVKGTIVFQNEEVVIFRDAEGARFQYPRSEVEAIISDETVENSEDSDQKSDELQEITTPKKASILLELGGGAGVNPNDAAGGAFGVDLLVGSHHIGDRHIFIGGGVGFHGVYMGAPDNYNFLPIQVAVRMPMMETKHAPMFGVALGYGVALSKSYLGGIYADVELGYRCQLNPRTAIGLVAYAQFQQATVPTTILIDGNPFDTKSGRSFVSSGLKLALYF